MYKKNKNTPGNRVGLYARVSTEEQAGGDRFSIPAQLNEMREFAQAHHWEIIGEFIDEGISGRKKERPQLQALLDIAKRKGCDIILVHELSRLSRSVYHTLEIFEDLGNVQIGFSSVKEPEFDFTDPSKRLFLTIIAAINEYYVELLKQHTSKSKRERSRQGLYNASIMPLGYDRGGDTRTPAVINQQESVTIQLIFDSYASGRFSDQDIADLLNQRGLKTRTGRRFSKDAISQILINPFYIGKIVYHSSTHEKEVFAGQHEAIITEGVWDKCQEVRSNRRSLSRAGQKNFRSYLLSHLATCDVCGRTLRAQGSASGSYYREMSYERGFMDCPHQKTGVRAAVLEQQIHYLMKHIQLPADWITELTDRAGSDSEMIKLRRQRERIEAERRRIQQMRIEGQFDENMVNYHDEMDRIRRESSALPSFDQIETLKITAKTIKHLYEIWETAEPGDQRDLLRLMLREVKIDVPNGRITSIIPLAVFVPIFRKLPLLYEYEFGEFIPLWNDHSLVSGKKLLTTIDKLKTAQALPFFDRNPLLPAAQVRNAPGIAEALRLLTPRKETKVVQIIEEDEIAFPMDLRKWNGAQGQSMNLEKFFDQPNESFDIVISQFVLWKHTNEDLFHKVLSKIKPSGVWYFNELLPLEFPSHWFFRVLPAAWEWVKKNTWSLSTLYNRLQEECTEISLKRHFIAHSTPPSFAEDAIKVRPYIVQALSEEAISSSYARITELTNDNSLLGSDFTIIEGWSKKR